MTEYELDEPDGKKGGRIRARVSSMFFSCAYKPNKVRLKAEGSSLSISHNTHLDHTSPCKLPQLEWVSRCIALEQLQSPRSWSAHVCKSNLAIFILKTSQWFFFAVSRPINEYFSFQRPVNELRDKFVWLLQGGFDENAISGSTLNYLDNFEWMIKYLKQFRLLFF